MLSKLLVLLSLLFLLHTNAQPTTALEVDECHIDQVCSCYADVISPYHYSHRDCARIVHNTLMGLDAVMDSRSAIAVTWNPIPHAKRVI
ncbi:hypothetical protein AGABI1DRAFT_112312 [Agaricus bisporus var. burnettii JB137-S8]|uniref:Uncharacterized protein n=1 Tax=Agaricus bisporus var. burnettii (strain JB137-S8 / ATCC MYA-4627 / FGSC 10392) TaxID=597362 RepID=K5W5Z9_AGABU|nr:uncharacterized protein AGABI1DRAFT_112312 [Agaricus bisporus var. burnettii JB137-S8]EKM82254.1 hypothetical protein AGABI1DRAFT_112312 [Agaricus bisporus var. burnettii JB137-S8]